MDPTALHDDCIVIDGLEISRWSRSVFEDMRKGRLTAVKCTCAVLESARSTMENIAMHRKDVEP